MIGWLSYFNACLNFTFLNAVSELFLKARKNDGMFIWWEIMQLVE